MKSGVLFHYKDLLPLTDKTPDPARCGKNPADNHPASAEPTNFVPSLHIEYASADIAILRTAARSEDRTGRLLILADKRCRRTPLASLVTNATGLAGFR